MPNTFILPSSRTVSLIVPLVFSGGVGAGVANVEVASWVTAAQVNGGSPSNTFISALDRFVTTEKTNGTWSLTDDMWLLWADDLPSARVSLKKLMVATAVNSPVHTPLRHVLFDGATNYINTGFVPSTHGTAMATTSVHLESYERVDVGTNSISAGVSSTGSRIMSIRPRVSSNASMSGNSGNGTFTLPASTSIGLTQVGRAGSLVTDVYGAKNGVTMTRTVDPSAVGASLPVDSLYIGCVNSAGTPTSFRGASVGFVAIGAALSTGTLRLARYNAVQQFATDIGAQV